MYRLSWGGEFNVTPLLLRWNSCFNHTQIYSCTTEKDDPTGVHLSSDADSIDSEKDLPMVKIETREHKPIVCYMYK